jgi:uncharacterized protein (PEP-CTERM system associated)
MTEMAMVIITQGQEPVIRCKVSFQLLKLTIASCCFISSFGQAGDLTFEKSIESTANVFNTSRTTGDIDGYALVLRPKLVSIYSSNRADGSFTIDNSQVKRGGDLDSDYQSYTNYSLQSAASLIDKTLSLSFSANQGYKGGNQFDSLVSDQIQNQENLTKTNNYTSSLSFTLPNPNFVGLNSRVFYAKSSADQTTIQQSKLDSTNTGISVNLFSGQKLNRLKFQFSGQKNNTTRANAQNFESTLLNGNIAFGLIDDFSLVILGSNSDYKIDSQTVNTNRQYINTKSYGTGFKWSPNDSRYFEVTYNNLEQNDLITKFIGVNAAWNFTPRTSAAISYGKRFYGNNYAANISYNLKSFKTSFSYSEDVTSYSRLSYSIESIGIFVCPIGSVEFSECVQVPDLSYVLDAGEEFRSLNDLSVDITDEVILNKVGQLNFGYGLRKMKVALGLTKREIEYLESQRVRKSSSININIDYRLGKRTNIGLSSVFADLETSEDEEISNENTLSITASLKRKLSDNATLTSSFRYVNRESLSVVRDVVDKRISVGLNYTF